MLIAIIVIATLLIFWEDTRIFGLILIGLLVIIYLINTLKEKLRNHIQKVKDTNDNNFLKLVDEINICAINCNNTSDLNTYVNSYEKLFDSLEKIEKLWNSTSSRINKWGDPIHNKQSILDNMENNLYSFIERNSKETNTTKEELINRLQNSQYFNKYVTHEFLSKVENLYKDNRKTKRKKYGINEYREELNGIETLIVTKDDFYIDVDLTPTTMDGSPDMRYKPIHRIITSKEIKEVTKYIEEYYNTLENLWNIRKRKRGFKIDINNKVSVEINNDYLMTIRFGEYFVNDFKGTLELYKYVLDRVKEYQNALKNHTLPTNLNKVMNINNYL